jgi:hypothetical protein
MKIKYTSSIDPCFDHLVPPYDDFTNALKKIDSDILDNGIISDLSAGYIDLSNLLYDFKGSNLLKKLSYDCLIAIVSEKERIIELWNPVNNNLPKLEELVPGAISMIESSEWDDEVLEERSKYHEQVFELVDKTSKLIVEELIDDFCKEFMNNERFISIAKNVEEPSIRIRKFLSEVTITKYYSEVSIITKKKFENLFIDPENAAPAYEYLRQNNAVDKKDNYLNSTRTIVIQWFYALKKLNLIDESFKGDVITSIINDKIKGLNAKTNDWSHNIERNGSNSTRVNYAISKKDLESLCADIVTLISKNKS